MSPRDRAAGPPQDARFKTKKSRETHERVLAAAIRLFGRKGFAKVSMREISKQGGLGLGALYYYFPSKEAIVQDFYAELNASVHARLAKDLDGYEDLGAAFAGFLETKLAALAPHRGFLPVLLKEAVDPGSPIGPLSEASRATRERSLSSLRAVVERLAPLRGDEADRAARGLWLAHLGLLVFWLHDRSPEQRATSQLIAVFATAIRLLPMAALLPAVKELVRGLKEPLAALFDDKEGGAS